MVVPLLRGPQFFQADLNLFVRAIQPMGGFKDLNRFGEMSPLRLLASAPDQAFHFWLHGVLEDLALYPLAQVARRVVLRIQLENRSDHGLRPFPIALRSEA